MSLFKIGLSLYLLTMIFRYFQSTWIHGRFPPEDWNYFDALDNTTTNAAESTNWRVFMKTGRRKPNVYTSVGVIKDDLKVG